MVLMLIESFFGREDLKLTSKLAKELPGMLNWSIAGYRRLRKRGQGLQSPAVRTLASPVKAFLEECCDIGAGLEGRKSWCWDVWKDWCVVQGTSPGNQVWFGRNLHSAVPGLTMKKARLGDADREHYYVGLRLKEEVIAPLRAEADRAEERRPEARRTEERRAEARRAADEPF